MASITEGAVRTFKTMSYTVLRLSACARALYDDVVRRKRMGACYTEETGTQKDIRASFYERASRDNATACHPGTASCATCAACATSATRTTRATYADRVSASHGGTIKISRKMSRRCAANFTKDRDSNFLSDSADCRPWISVP